MSMSPEIMKRYIRLTTAQDIWKALSKVLSLKSSSQKFVYTANGASTPVIGERLLPLVDT
ncbi:hypothetical protein Lal_00036915 [Lupinus albus]|nr:hypothetical protein Lal_00036915 [Lupinus albus]